VKKYPFYSTEKLMLLLIACISLFDGYSDFSIAIRAFSFLAVCICFFSSPKEE
jgi:hypothetical protein